MNFQTPQVFVKSILKIHEKYTLVIKEVFQGDRIFVDSLDKACKIFINDNALSRANSDKNKPAEFLARYCDLLLNTSNNNLDETELKNSLNEVVSFSFLLFFSYFLDLV